MNNEQEKQPGVCGQPCEVYSRVVGYLRPVQQWNKGKKAEYFQRRVFDHAGKGEIQEVAPDTAADTPADADINKAMNKRFEGSAGY